MNYKDIKDFGQRYKEHYQSPDGVLTSLEIRKMMLDEITELRAYIEWRKDDSMNPEKERT